MRSSRRFRQLEAALAEPRAAADDQRREMAERRREIERLREALDNYAVAASAAGAVGSTGVEPPSCEPAPTSKRSTRRALLTGGAVAAGASLAGSFVAAKPAAAADGGNMVIGADNQSVAGNTRLVTTAGANLTGTSILSMSSASQPGFSRRR